VPALGLSGYRTSLPLRSSLASGSLNVSVFKKANNPSALASS
jgi:hypothetical protein